MLREVRVHIDQEPWDGPDGVRLRAAQRAELDARYGTDDHEPGAVPTGADVTVFVVARDHRGRAVGCGGLRFLGPGTAEVKRMYVEPAERGRGAATRILRELEDRARGAGAVRVVLETGTRQPEAIRFYEREGYARVPNFGPYAGAPESVCYARDLG
jgi:GNAT superfamily N-acetyltransferase